MYLLFLSDSFVYALKLYLMSVFYPIVHFEI